MDKSVEHVNDAEINQSNKNLNESGTKEINEGQTVENKNQVELNDSKKINNVDDKNSNAKETQNMEKNVEGENKSNEDKNLNGSVTQETGTQQMAKNENQVELNSNEKIDNMDNKNSNLDEKNLVSKDSAVPETKNEGGANQSIPNQGENEAELANKIKEFISHAATLTLRDFRRAYVKLNCGSGLNEEEQKKLKAEAKVPDDLSDVNKVQKLVDILLSINENNAKDYSIDPERLDETKFIISRMLSGDYRKRIVKSIDNDIVDSMTAKDIVIHTMYGGIVQADVYIKKSQFLKNSQNFAKVYKIITDMTENNMYEYVDKFGAHRDINSYKFILSLLCITCEEYKKRWKDVIKGISDRSILEVCYTLSDKEIDIVLNYLPVDLRIKVFIMCKAKLSLVEIYDSKTIPECLNTEEARRKLIEEIKSINQENARDYVLLNGESESKFILSNLLSDECREIQDSISDREVFNRLQIQDIIIQMAKEPYQSITNVANRYEFFLGENNRANEKLLLETVAQINKNNASKYGITNVEDLDKKKFFMTCFSDCEEVRSKVTQTIGDDKLLDMFYNMNISEQVACFPRLPRSIRKIKTLDKAFGNKKWWKDELNKETGKMEPTDRKKKLLQHAVDYVDPDNNNQNNYAGGHNGYRFDYAEYLRQMNNLFQNMFMQWQTQQQQQMQQMLQQQRQIQQQRMQQQMQMFNTANEERELNQLIAQKSQLEFDHAQAASINDLNNELNGCLSNKKQLETRYSDLEKPLLEYTKNLIDHVLAYMNSYEELPGYAKLENENAGKLYSVCQKLSEVEAFKSGEINSDRLFSVLSSLQNISEDMKQIKSTPRLNFYSKRKQIYAKNFGLSLFYFFGVDAFVRVISGSKNKEQTGELSSGNKNKDQSWDKLFVIDALALLVGISMIVLFVFMNLATIAYISIAITAAEQVVTTILKLYRLNHMPRFILRNQAVVHYNKAARSLFDDINNFLSGDKSQEYNNLIGVKTDLDDINRQISNLEKNIQEGQSQTRPNVNAEDIRAQLDSINRRINVLTNQINVKRQQQRQVSFGMFNNNARVPNMYNGFNNGFNNNGMLGARVPNMHNGFNNNCYNNNGWGY